MSDDVYIRQVLDHDWDSIVALESRAYTGLGLSEDRAVLRSRADASPSTCFVLDTGSRLAGYLPALPYPAFRYPELEQPETTAVPSRNLHLHDIVIAPGLRRRGLAGRLLDHLVLATRSRRYERISLVAVGGSERFWSVRGFTAHPGIVSPHGYGTEAVYMSMPVPAARQDEVS